MTKSTFGEHLKREREMRGVSLDEISSATRIGTRFLEALEDEQWDRLPGGIFNRGFVRAVARFLGLDEENLVAEYALATNDRPDVAVWAKTSPSEKAGARWLWLVVLLVVVAVAAGGWFAWRRHIFGRAARVTAPAGARPTTPQSLGGASATTPSAAQPAAPSAVPPASSPAPSAQSGQAAATPLTGAASAQPAMLELTVSAGKTAQVSVIADGKSVFEGKMTAGESQHFGAQERFEVGASNSSALLLELNGQTMAPMGPPGQPGKVTLTRNDLKKTPGGPD